MSVLDDLLKKHRKRIVDREAQAFRELLDAYERVRRELRRQILALQKKVKDAKAAGEEISPAWFLQQNRLNQLTDQVKMQIERFGGTAARITTREQRAAVEIALSQAKETIAVVSGQSSVAGGIGSMINPRVIENAVGMMGDGSPILEYYAKNLAPRVVEMIRSEVIQAAAIGTDFRTIANRLIKTGDITRQRALTAARTEVNRVRRETTRQYFEDNSDIITGWEWVASKSSRTCAVCLAMDGTIHKTSEFFPQHVNCRCTLIAVIAGVERPPRTIGSEWFERQPDDVREKVLGKEAAEAYSRGEVELKDFVGWRNSKEFGRSVYTRKLSDVLMNKPGK